MGRRLSAKVSIGTRYVVGFAVVPQLASRGVCDSKEALHILRRRFRREKVGSDANR